ncbi:hypothetical protein [Nocardia lijiangensis]|uniref:hypothetical protein n=1 Tax=Nocardia lijiangensis TaxID=299618 RepID=UPI0012DF19FF|nr:hypothetical protein [Nocardia lijiangensis]
MDMMVCSFESVVVQSDRTDGRSSTGTVPVGEVLFFVLATTIGASPDNTLTPA